MLRPPIGVGIQPPLKIRLEVGQRLEAHGEAHQALGDAGRGARLRARCGRAWCSPDG